MLRTDTGQAFIVTLWKHILPCTPPMKICKCYLWQQSFCGFFNTLHFNISAHCSWSTSKHILKVLWASNLHPGNENFRSFCSCNFVRDCRVWEIFNCLKQKKFWSLWLPSCQNNGSVWCRILPIAPVKIHHRCTIYETYFLTWMPRNLFVRSRSLDCTRPACIHY